MLVTNKITIDPSNNISSVTAEATTTYNTPTTAFSI